MPQETLSMKRLREVLRLKLTAGLSNRAIGRAINISPGTVSNYVRAMSQSGLDWPRVEQLDDQELISLLIPHCSQRSLLASPKHPLDCAKIYQELKKKGVTLLLLHEEYQQQYGHEHTYGYSSYCQTFRGWLKQQKPSMRMVHIAGEKAFVDYAGPTIDIYNSLTGETLKAKIFIGVLGASNFTYAEATLTRSIPDWIGSHVRMLHFFGGVPEFIIPDNEKAAVTNACYYDPELNPNYASFASHYQVTILPTRPAKPKDKAKVENAVQVVERWILARLRHHQFFSLSELNEAISRLLIDLNNKPFKKIPGTRATQFALLDKPLLKALPKTDYHVFDFYSCSVRLDYHIEVEKHYYSVPHHLIGQVVECRISHQLIEIYYQHKRIATHVRSHAIGQATTDIQHMPAAHRHYQQWSPLQFKQWAENIGKSTQRLCEDIIQAQTHPECCQRIHSGFKNLSKRYGNELLEKACHYALAKLPTPGYRSIKSILSTKLYQEVNDAESSKAKKTTPILHKNIRGKNYYDTTTIIRSTDDASTDKRKT